MAKYTDISVVDRMQDVVKFNKDIERMDVDLVGELQRQAAQKAEIEEWKSQIGNRAKKSQADTEQAVAKAELAEYEASNKEVIFDAEQRERDAIARLKETEAKHRADYEQSRINKNNRANQPDAPDPIIDDGNDKNNWMNNMTTGGITKAIAASERTLRDEREIYNTEVSNYQAASLAMQQLADPNIGTDALSNIKTIIGGYAAAFGLSLPEGWDQAGQESVRAFGATILAKIVQNGPRISDKDLEVLQRSTVNYTNTEKTNMNILRYQKAVSRWNNERFQFIQNEMNNESLYRIADSEWNKKYGTDFVGAAIDADGELITFYEYWDTINQRAGSKIPEKKAIEEWRKRYVK